MTSALTPCSSCKRHVEVGASTCPFCGAPMSTSVPPAHATPPPAPMYGMPANYVPPAIMMPAYGMPSPPEAGRRSRGTAIAIGVALALAAAAAYFFLRT